MPYDIPDTPRDEDIYDEVAIDLLEGEEWAHLENVAIEDLEERVEVLQSRYGIDQVRVRP